MTSWGSICVRGKLTKIKGISPWLQTQSIRSRHWKRKQTKNHTTSETHHSTWFFTTNITNIYPYLWIEIITYHVTQNWGITLHHLLQDRPHQRQHHHLATLENMRIHDFKMNFTIQHWTIHEKSCCFMPKSQVGMNFFEASLLWQGWLKSYKLRLYRMISVLRCLRISKSKGTMKGG